MQSLEIKEMIHEFENILYGFTSDEFLAYLHHNIDTLENKWDDIQYIVESNAFRDPNIISNDESRLMYLYLVILRYWGSRN